MTPRLDGINLNLLLALDVLLAELNVTRAARRLGITQSAMSHSLAALRESVSEALGAASAPARVVVVDDIPMLSTGKPDRLGLAALVRD